jgi:hypothetical protein
MDAMISLYQGVELAFSWDMLIQQTSNLSSILQIWDTSREQMCLNYRRRLKGEQSICDLEITQIVYKVHQILYLNVLGDVQRVKSNRI